MDTIYGIKPVLELLRYEPARVKKLLVAHGKAGSVIMEILGLAKEHGIPISYEERSKLAAMTASASHQGVIALCSPYRYRTVEEILANVSLAKENRLILLLDGITDPQNLGSIIRTAHCFGISGVIIPKNRAAQITPTVIKASAGAANHIPVAMVTNLVETIKMLKKNDFWIYGADAARGEDAGTFQLPENMALVLGSEGSGIRPLVKNSCDFLLTIPLYGKLDSLNVSVAAGILLYEIVRKWRRGV